MLASTFQHLDGIGAHREKRLWNAGILNWSDFVSHREPLQFSLFPGRLDNYTKDPLAKSRSALASEDTDFFAHRLPRSEYYRIALTYPSNTVFLDIETTGLSRYYDHVTMIGWSQAEEYYVYISGEDPKPLSNALLKAKALVTFNGSLFDIPFLIKELGNVRIPLAHIDLRFAVRHVGMSGGQKEVEIKLGIKRPAELADVNGSIAPLLWNRYSKGDREALKLLIEYNHSDIEGMKSILDDYIELIARKREVPKTLIPPVRFSNYKSKIRWQNDILENKRVSGAIQITRYMGPKPITAVDILPITQLSNSRFIGIDLTGSPERPSGWCFLEGCLASTRRIGSDDEIITLTQNCRPTLVSIDSPLSLPIGRTIVSDDDTGRAEYGIMRQCERILKKRGVNVYPSLIKSMQGLTQRGIHLANSLRSLGIPVIESFPGAAQDILNIPRKRTSQEYLKRGLNDFGIVGEFVDNEVSHDELDAITSAIVALFFWGGRYEALGNPDEDYLIIPDLSHTQNWEERCVIGLSGRINAGKTTAGKFLETKGYYYTRFSLALDEILMSRNIIPTRESRQEIGNDINRKAGGQRWLCKQLVRNIPPLTSAVVDGLRHPEDHAFMVERFGPSFRHVYIEASQEIRTYRDILAGHLIDEFIMAEQHPVETQISKLSALAHISITNQGSVDDFTRAVYQVLSHCID